MRYSSSLADLDWAEAGLDHFRDYGLDCRHKEFWQTLNETVLTCVDSCKSNLYLLMFSPH